MNRYFYRRRDHAAVATRLEDILEVIPAALERSTNPQAKAMPPNPPSNPTGAVSELESFEWVANITECHTPVVIYMSALSLIVFSTRVLRRRLAFESRLLGLMASINTTVWSVGGLGMWWRSVR